LIVGNYEFKKERSNVMKIIKKNNGFTLVELIVVIAIIGILAAVLIPTISGFIDKARFSNDVTDAKNMTTILQANTVDVDRSLLQAPDIRNIINSTDKNYSFVPRSKNAHFWYNSKTGKIEVTKSIEEAVQLYAAENFTPDSVEEIYEDLLYLNVQGELATVLNTIRNLTSIDQFSELDNKEDKVFEGVDISHIIDQFDPKRTLFINNMGGFTDYEDEDKTQKITNIVFASNITVIPSLKALYQTIGGHNKRFADKINLVIPFSVHLIEGGAFEEAGSITSDNVVFTVKKISSNKVQVVEGAFNQATVSVNTIARPTVTAEEYGKKIVRGNTFIDVKVFKTGGEIEFTPKQDGSNMEPRQHGILQLNTLLDCTSGVTSEQYQKIEISTKRLMAEYPGINNINATYYAKVETDDESFSYITLVASDSTGVVVNLQIKTWQK
jgi:type IV pilus assembly protein PilA